MNHTKLSCGCWSMLDESGIGGGKLCQEHCKNLEVPDIKSKIEIEIPLSYFRNVNKLDK